MTCGHVAHQRKAHAMTIKTYTIDRSEYDTVNDLTIATATVTLSTDEGAPIQPIAVRQLSSGWVGAEWVRYVADYQDSQSVGYATLADFEREHEWTADMGLDFEPIKVDVKVLGREAIAQARI